MAGQTQCGVCQDEGTAPNADRTICALPVKHGAPVLHTLIQGIGALGALFVICCIARSVSRWLRECLTGLWFDCCGAKYGKVKVVDDAEESEMVFMSEDVDEMELTHVTSEESEAARRMRVI